jgi:hypothetical protein
MPRFWPECLILTGWTFSGNIAIGRRRRSAGIFRARGAARKPANETCAGRIFITAAFAAVLGLPGT